MGIVDESAMGGHCTLSQMEMENGRRKVLKLRSWIVCIVAVHYVEPSAVTTAPQTGKRGSMLVSWLHHLISMSAQRRCHAFISQTA